MTELSDKDFIAHITKMLQQRRESTLKKKENNF
jgi:uncharacterized protein YqeY